MSKVLKLELSLPMWSIFCYFIGMIFIGISIGLSIS